MMESTLPSHIMFYRTPIPTLETPPQETPIPSRKAASSAAAELDAASEPLPPSKPQLATIFGSVSTADIAESIKAVLATTRGGTRVVISAEDVTILAGGNEGLEHQEQGIEGDRIKALGEFQVEARVKGGDPVVRTVTVRAQEAIAEA